MKTKGWIDFRPDMNKSPKSKRVLIFIIITASIGWISVRLWDGFDQISATVSSLEPSYLFLSLVPAMVSAFLSAYIYSLVLSRTVAEEPPLPHVMRHFIVSQVVRHLPGKIWGVFYQVNAMAKWVLGRATVQANFEHYALLNYNAIAIALSVFALLKYGMFVSLGVYSSTLLLLFVALKTDFLSLIMSIITKVFSGSKEPFERCIKKNNNLLIMSLLQVDWFFYLLTCLIILPAFTSLKDALIIGTCYAIAWFVGAMTIILPGGVVVREASFLWITGLFGFGPVEMFIFSIVARTLFTLADVLCALLAVSVVRDS